MRSPISPQPIEVRRRRRNPLSAVPHVEQPPLRPDYKAMQAFHKDRRSEERLRAHYLLERHLARRLLDTPQVARGKAYSEAYGELFRSVPDHPQVGEKHGERGRRVRLQTSRLRRHLGDSKTFLEIGCGDALLASRVAAHVACSHALDITDALIDRSSLPDNLNVIVIDGTDIPLPASSIDVAFSDQLMEHLCPEDGRRQLEEIWRVLKPGGIYRCITPNRVTGPHDISCFFDYEATGFHLREYDSVALVSAFRAAGFRRIRFFVSLSSLGVPIPAALIGSLEWGLSRLPDSLRGRASRNRIVRALAGLDVIGVK